MRYEVFFSPLAESQLARLRMYIATRATPEIADNYVEAVISCAEDLDMFPHRGILRDDLRPGLRVISYRKRTSIAFSVDDGKHRVIVLGVAHGGQDYEALFADL